MLPPSGRGVSESLALAHAPLIRIPGGTFSGFGFWFSTSGGTISPVFSDWENKVVDRPSSNRRLRKLERKGPSFRKSEYLTEKRARQALSRPENLTITTSSSLQGTQEIQNILSLAGAEVVKVVLDRGGLAATTIVALNGADQVLAAAIVQEEDPLSQAPQRRSAELVSTGPALTNVIRQDCAHVVDLKVAEQVGGCAAQTGRLIRPIGLE